MVFDKWENGIPVTFIISAKSRQKDIHAWLKKLGTHCKEVQANWRSGSIIVDNAQAELNTIA